MAVPNVNAGQMINASDINTHINQTNSNTSTIATLQSQIATLQNQVATLQAGTFSNGLNVTGDISSSGVLNQNGHVVLDGRGGNTYINASGSAVILTVNGSHILQSNSSGNVIIPTGSTYGTGTP